MTASSRSSLLAVASILGLLAGCSWGIGAVAAPALYPEREPNAGVAVSSIADVSLCDCTMNVAVGLQSQVLQSTTNDSKWGDWRLQGVLGFTQTPRPFEPRIGYELLFTPGAARYHTGDRAELGWVLGGLAGFPVRLSSTRPSWRADDLVGLNVYLVPSLGANWLGFERLEATGSLALRIYLWSAITP